KPILEAWMAERRDPRVQLRRLVDAWPEIADDLLLVPELLHRKLREAAMIPQREPVRSARERYPQRGAGGRGGEVRHRRRDRQLTGAVLLIAGVLWAGLAAEPVWVGWIGAGLGLLMLLRAMR